MKIKSRIFSVPRLSSLSVTMILGANLISSLVATRAMALPVCVQNGGVTICNDGGVVTSCSSSGGVGICTDSRGHTNVATTQGDKVIVTGTDGTHVYENPNAPKPQPDYNRGGMDRQGQWDRRDQWDRHNDHQYPGYPNQSPSYPDPSSSYPDPSPSYPDPSPSYPDPSPSYPDPTPSYPDTSSPANTNSVASFCEGNYVGKFASGEKVALQFLEDGTINLKARGQVYPASGNCEVVAKGKAEFTIMLDDDNSYGFSGTITKATNGAKKMSAKQTKNGRTIDRLSLVLKK
jgi:hypothetical protein